MTMQIQGKDLVVAGQAADGAGGLVCWAGMGALGRPAILAALSEAGLPVDWAPVAVTSKAHAGDAIRRLNSRGYIVRAARRADLQAKTGVRPMWDARWIVARSHAASGEVGGSAGTVEVAIELRGEAISFEGDDALASEVREIFNALRAEEVYQAGDVTVWLGRVLCREMGATKLGLGHYVPAAQRARANALCAAMMIRWGRSWMCPLLPVATSDELRIGLARGMEDDVRAIAQSVENARSSARGENRQDMTPGKAASFLRSLGEVQERLGAYRSLCGDRAIAPAQRLIAELIADLATLADATSQRAALIELNDIGPAPVTAAEIESPAPTPIKKVRGDDFASLGVGGAKDDLPAIVRPAPVPFKVPAPPELDFDLSDAPARPVIEVPGDITGTAERFSLIELD